MPCYHPMPAVRLTDGSVKFISRSARNAESAIELPCGQCVGCRLERSRQWAMRVMHEASLYESNSFITLTYDDANLPEGGNLVYSDFQLFMKRFRKRTGHPVRFYMCGEYGEEFNRPHFHACIFGFGFPDKVFYRRTSGGDRLYTSKLLEDLWPKGLSSVGDVTFKSAAYVARYCMGKITGDLAESHYRVVTDEGEIVDRTPEFNHMSLKPGIGARWLAKFRTDVFPRDYVVVNGVKTKPPFYYDELYKREFPGEFSELVAQRELNAYGHYLKGEMTEPRLYAKEQVVNARISSLKRKLK
ncbi:MAG: replication initiator protein [Microviridae sp.]|nr:MAG: replication initiator protein [Microviridae sp.]